MKPNLKNKNGKKNKRSAAQIETKVRVDEAIGHLKNKHYNKALLLFDKVSEHNFIIMKLKIIPKLFYGISI